MAGNNLDPKLQAWVDARRRHHLSHAHVQMARELGMNPKKLGKLDNHRQESWKLPLPQFIESLYEKRFGRSRPQVVRPIEASAAEQAKRQAKRRNERRRRREGASPPEATAAGDLVRDDHAEAPATPGSRPD
jgi:hypothetical protein